MINSIKDTSSYKALNLNKNLSHAYLFYSPDKELNNSVALTFAKSLICINNNCCNECDNCKQFNSSSHADVTIVNQPSIKVEDVNNIIAKLSTLPISAKYKLFVILDAENMNETAQNKLLKSLEEPTSANIFILTCTKTDKLLPTILSRLNKQFVPKLNNQDKLLISNELRNKNTDISQFINADFSLTDMLTYSTSDSYKETLETIKQLFTNLKTSADIPACASKLNNVDKNLFLPLLQNIMLDVLNDTNKFDYATTQVFKNNFSKLAIINCLPLIENAYKKQMANVSLSYIIDILLFNILKEKFLCR